METSTHTVFLGEVVDGDVNSADPAMTYAYYHKVVKGKSPKNAPTYLPEEDEPSGRAVWKCSVCGYVYDGETPFEELPDTYTCPICRQPKGKIPESQLIHWGRGIFKNPPAPMDQNVPISHFSKTGFT